MDADPALGIFETFLVCAGRPVEFDLHLQRLARSLEALYGLEPPVGLRAEALARARGVELGRERLTVVPTDHGHSDVDIRVAAVDPADVFPGWERAVTLVPGLVRGGLGPHKWVDRRPLGPLEAAAGEEGVPLLLDVGDVVLEASRGNVFMVLGGALVTPPADERILSGVTRSRMLDLAADLGLPRREEPIDLDRLLEADELFLTGGVRGVEPVCSVHGRRTWREGVLTPIVSHALQRAWADPTAAPPSGAAFPSRT